MTSVSNFFSREAMLKRQARTISARTVEQGHLCPSASLRSKPLRAIVEEADDLRASSSRSPSPSARKVKRRHANITQIRVTEDSDLAYHQDDLLCAPRPAPRPPTPSPHPSPDSFKLNFTDVSFTFPHPPIPTPSSLNSYARDYSPTPSMDSLSSSPGSQPGGMPLTPSTSDDEFVLPSPRFNPRRAAIQPLLIAKHTPRASSPVIEEGGLSTSFLQPCKTSAELASSPSVSPVSARSFLSYDSDEQEAEVEETDSEWYTKEFSKIISLRSPLPPNFPLARPESMAISCDTLPYLGRKRVSKALPPTPLIPRRGSKRRNVVLPKYAPPPVPAIPNPFLDARPPPRMSLPSDCDFEFEDGTDEDDMSDFSFAMYEVDYFGSRSANIIEEESTPLTPESPRSSYSQPSLEVVVENHDTISMSDVKFDVDVDSSMMLPLSLPTTPLDLEADIRMGLEQLRSAEASPEPPTASDEYVEESTEEVEEEIEVEIEEIQQPQSAAFSDVFSPSPAPSPEFVSPASPAPSTLSSFSFSTYSSNPNSPAPYTSYTSYAHQNTSPYADDHKMLKSKWSTSTLASLHEEHARRGASAKLRLYFGGGEKSPKHKRGSSSVSSGLVSPSSSSPSSSPNGKGQSLKERGVSAKVPKTPVSPTGLRGMSLSPKKRSSHSRRESDVMVIGYGQQGHGVRRRGSVTPTVSECGSDESGLSSTSSGLRRKPIPVEMFLRA